MELDTDRGVKEEDDEDKTEQRRIEDEDEKKSSNKGKGLKKWKRIQRSTINTNTASNTEEEDLHRFLKRDSRRFAIPNTSSTGAGDSDNSEGKSSTAASAPTKFRHHHHRTSAAAANRTLSSAHRPKMETSTKKLRGGDNERDVSYSSVESDLRSSNVFSNGRHIHYDDDDDVVDRHSNHYEEEDEISATANINGPTTSQDLLTDAILSLHAVHQALQNEIQSFGEIGKEAVVLKADELVFEEEVKGKLESRVGELERELLGIMEEGEESKWREMEQLFTHKIEVEVQCLVIRQQFKDQNNNKNITLVLHTDASSEDDNPLKLRSAASKYGLCFFVQFIFLFLVLLRLLFLQLWPDSTGFVPT